MEAAPVCSPRLRLPGSSFSLIDVIHQLEGGHAFALSDATNCEQETTGVILICSRGRVKFVIPGGPGHRPAVGLALQMMSFCLSITSRWMAPAFSTVCEVQNEPTTGSRVTLEVERSGRGSLDTVVCMRAPLNFVQHSMDLHAVLNQHRQQEQRANPAQGSCIACSARPRTGTPDGRQQSCDTAAAQRHRCVPPCNARTR
jgi:hypothetical protein